MTHQYLDYAARRSAEPPAPIARTAALHPAVREEIACGGWVFTPMDAGRPNGRGWWRRERAA